MYLLGLACGVVFGGLAIWIALTPGDGWQDVTKGQTTLQQFRDAGIGVKKD
jgi:hypothetical protein